jgi:acetyl/propionyl-CoA carboxylase alpha subunit
MVDTTKNTPDKGGGRKRVDWVEARKFYMEDNTRSYSDVAKKYGVSVRAVELQAKAFTDESGKMTTWAIHRKNLGERVSVAHEEALVDKKTEADQRHLTHFTNVQALLNNKIQSMSGGVPYTDRNGNIVINEKTMQPFMVQPDGKELHEVARALQVVINGERVILGLPTTVSAITDKDGNNVNYGWADALAEASKILNNGGEPQ